MCVGHFTTALFKTYLSRDLKFARNFENKNVKIFYDTLMTKVKILISIERSIFNYYDIIWIICNAIKIIAYVYNYLPSVIEKQLLFVISLPRAFLFSGEIFYSVISL